MHYHKNPGSKIKGLPPGFSHNMELSRNRLPIHAIYFLSHCFLQGVPHCFLQGVPHCFLQSCFLQSCFLQSCFLQSLFLAGQSLHFP